VHAKVDPRTAIALFAGFFELFPDRQHLGRRVIGDVGTFPGEDLDEIGQARIVHAA
jgi:hypothetical protein